MGVCVIASGVTRQFGVLASDSSMYDTQTQQMGFEAPKLFVAPKSGCAMSFIGTPLYLEGLAKETWQDPFHQLVAFLSEWFQEKRDGVAKKMADTIPDPDENKPHFCALVLGMHKGFPTVAQLNSFADFKPTYLWTANKPKFSTILYGDDSKPGKAEIFKEASEAMRMRASEHETLTPGLLAEALTRGIYHKADVEQKKYGKKYAGGAVSAVVVSAGGALSLSGAYPLAV